MPSELHITNGDASGGTVLRAVDMPPERLLVFWDDLSCGPWVEMDDLEGWNRVRQSFAKTLNYRECYGLSQGACDQRYKLPLDTTKLAQARSIFLWIGSGLADQLLLVWLVRFFKCAGVDVRKLRVLQFQHVPGGDYEVTSLSGLKPETVLQLGHPVSLDDSELDRIATVWKALVAPQPDLLTNLLADTGDWPLPLLNRSLRSLLRRYPDRQTGLNILDAALLNNTRDVGPSAVRIIGATMGGNWDSLDDPSDFYLYHRLRRMGDATLNCELVELGGTSPAMRDTEVRITQTGLDVLDGKANVVAINGIDEWVCGVHLCSETNDVWYRDGDALTGPGF